MQTNRITFPYFLGFLGFLGRKMLLLLLLGLPFSAAEAQTLVFETPEQDFETITEGESLVRTFTYVNQGEKPLLVAEIRTTCGCTLVEWDKNPLPPQGRSQIKVRFESQNKVGKQHKVISVLSNDPQNPIQKIALHGIVLPKG
ncbi:DUF1573 domain-containing protein [Hugenholtzia roseola]|uniref:DUF1573 domain-containing protein n=1 Tax=Hugenholtzia roseola TaxID=1002 RepID=UPI0003FCC870|nr:DUF1573 domain-containing protein [Hugenholtzia roseola]